MDSDSDDKTCLSSPFVKLKQFLLSSSALFLFNKSLERTNFSVARDFLYEIPCLQRKSKWMWHLKCFWTVWTDCLKTWDRLSSKLLKFGVHRICWIRYITEWGQLSINQEKLFLKQIKTNPSFKYHNIISNIFYILVQYLSVERIFFIGAEIRTVCRPLQFFCADLGKPCLCGPHFH